MKIVSLLLALTASGVVNFPGGTAVVTPSRGMQHVVVKGAHGAVTSDSYCDSSTGTYAIVTKVSRMEPHDVFCRNGMAMFAGGTLWVEKNASGAIRARVVNL